MNDLQRQAAFEKMVTGLYYQGALSYYIDLGPPDVNMEQAIHCRYRYDNKKCAIGHLIDDEHYDPSMEDQGIAHEKVKAAVRKSLGLKRLSEDDLSFLHRAQMCLHDDLAENLAAVTNCDVKTMRKELMRKAGIFATIRHLDISFFEDLTKTPVTV